MLKQPLRIAFAGDKAIAVTILKFILSRGVKPLALLITDKEKNSTSRELIKLCPHLQQNFIFKNDHFQTQTAVNQLKALKLDYLISIHFPFLFSESVLNIPLHGILNLHPAYLPYNRGWHTATWSILSQTPFGATLHFMDKTIDTGDIIRQKLVKVNPEDTADTLYRRALAAELQIFKEAWPAIKNFSYNRQAQIGKGTFHFKKDIKKIQPIFATALINKLRALSTSKLEDLSYFLIKKRKYRVKITIIPEKEKL